MSTKRLCAMCWGKLRDAGTQTRQASSDWAKTICDGCGERRYTTAFEVTAAKKSRQKGDGQMSMWQQLDATIAESVGATMDTRGRGFASATEAWGEIKKTLHSAKKAQQELGKLHDETWQQIITNNEDGITAMLREFRRAATNQAANLVQLAALSKIAMELTDE